MTETVYDEVGRISSVSVDGAETAHYLYYANGSCQATVYADGTREDYVYNAASQVVLLTHTGRAGNVLDCYEYQYDAAGNLLRETSARGTTAYTYDADGRLSTAVEPDGKATGYTYDAAGNRTSKEVIFPDGNRIATAYEYDSSNRLLAERGSDGSVIRYEYDANGNLLRQETTPVEPAETEGGSGETGEAGIFGNAAETEKPEDAAGTERPGTLTGAAVTARGQESGTEEAVVNADGRAPGAGRSSAGCCRKNPAAVSGKRAG